MMHLGVMNVGGDMPSELSQKVEKLMREFLSEVREIVQQRQLSRAMVRSLLSGSTVYVLTKDKLFALAQSHHGMSTVQYIHKPEMSLSIQQAMHSARWEFDFEDPFLVVFPSALLDQDQVQRKEILKAIALVHVESEVQRVIKMTSLIQVNPLFGPASYAVDPRLVFVLMPFADDLTKIYLDIIKPTVELNGLVCRRADDFKTNKAIIQDIWKAICEARFVIADLTDLNPNVMYELGITHTVGKETILIYQRGRGKEPIFPFDLAHIRRIEYEDNAAGGKRLEVDLGGTLKNLLQPVALS